MPVACLLLWASLLTGAWPATPTQDHLPATPRVRLSFKELKATGTAHFFNFLLNTTDYRILLKDEDHDRMYVGSKDYVLSLDLHDINREPLIIHWAASPQRIEECVLSGKDGNGECGNFVRLIQPWNRTHLYVCGTGAYNPMCTYVNRGRRAQDYIFYLEPERLESGKGKCPYDPKLDTASALINEELYAGVYIDFMGTDAAIFRTLGKQTAMRTDQYNSRWLNDPSFIHAELIPDSAERNDDKLYFFFRERSAEAPQSPAVYARIGRICLNDDGGHCCLVNKWSTFLKARLVCSVPGEDGIETHFDELQDVFVQQTQDVRNPVIYAVFTSSGSVFRGSAVCVYSMADIRMVFNGPFAHKEGPNYQWMPFSGKMPYPRPGTCPGGTFTPSMKSTKDYPDEVINFMRSHPLMYQAVYPLQRRPLVVRTGAPYRLTTVAVDQVDAADGRYEVLFLGTDRGTVQKVIVLPKDDQEMEELMLEEVEVFKEPAPVKTMTISSKRQQLYVASAVGVTHLSLHRCQAYGAACADCCLARDPYCAWDGQSCSRYTASSKRRSRRQDVRHGNPIRQCRGFNSNANKNTVESVQYGVAGSAAFLECQPRSPQATVKWLFQRDPSDRRREVYTPWHGNVNALKLYDVGIPWRSPRFMEMRSGNPSLCEDSIRILQLDSCRGPLPAHRARLAAPRPAARGPWPLLLHGHREQLQACRHAGAAARPGPGCRPRCPLPTASGERPTAPRRRSSHTPLPGAGPATGPARSGPHPPVLPGLLAPRAPKPQGGPRCTQAS
ncbi:semaphorin-3F isoform X3 [Mustela putorius furo]|uniref:Semaphorin-3F isoform X3 n=1 Tax=Mustela putorius furo TaxID=9669 RepID=A0A8U0S6I6_MUSPF|nr:semaphorin-3F isoform X3 [Mustela putorius furo]